MKNMTITTHNELLTDANIFMQVPQFIRTIYHMQNVKRWSEFSPQYVDTAASRAQRVGSYSVLALLSEKHLFHNEYDELHVIGRALFHDLNVTITGSIKHRTKKDPLVSDFITRFQQEASEQIVNYIDSPAIREHIRPFLVNAEDDTKEGKLVRAIDTFDSMMFCHREVLHGSNPFFKRKFEEQYEELKQIEIPSIKWLLEEFDKKVRVYQFFVEIMQLDRVERWSTNFNLIPDDDATHTFRATALAYYHAMYEITHEGATIDLVSLLGKVLFHDLVEAITGDVKGPLKHSTKETKEAFERYEREVSEMMVTWLPEALQADMYEYMVEAKNDTPEGLLVDIADKQDALVKAKLEKRINPSYESVYTKQLQKINRKFQQPSVVHFLDDILQHIELGID